MNPPGRLLRYPGSPRLARALMRPGDQLLVNELHAEDAAALRALFARDPGTKVLGLDGWMALKSLLPPKERRGAILIDPPFEEPDELERMRDALREAVARFATGIYLLWYPIKDDAQVAGFIRKLRRLDIAKALRAEVIVSSATDALRLRGTGLVVVNPPWTLHDEMAVLLPALAAVLARDGRPRVTLEWLAGERSR
jgi:23S rRNA (adenine2030-N6)-methyltransferase